MDNIAFFRFYGEIIDLVTAKDKKSGGTIEYCFTGTPSVKDAIEAIGPPHTEIAAILVNSISIGFDYLLHNNENVDVYSPGTNPLSSDQQLLSYRPKGEPKFILDVHLGALAHYLRFTGFDTKYNNVDSGDEVIASTAQKESRVLLTRDIGLLKRSIVKYGYWLRHTQPDKQFIEVARRYRLNSYLKPFTRCTICNGLLHEVEKAVIEDGLPPVVRSYYDDFWQCQQCHQIYWKGSHYKSIKTKIDLLIKTIS